MNGLMMDWPLVIPSILRRAASSSPIRRSSAAWLTEACIGRITANQRAGFIG